MKVAPILVALSPTTLADDTVGYKQISFFPLCLYPINSEYAFTYVPKGVDRRPELMEWQETRIVCIYKGGSLFPPQN